ncbi:hypothetical protein OHS81_17085 [Streptomyces sp. NBC_00400]|uniref:hypothetical protein n=1 Tax=Streptomyces sp. NBC_00400 TaxID=2975737 RepID=UPI002E238CC6
MARQRTGQAAAYGAYWIGGQQIATDARSDWIGGQQIATDARSDWIGDKPGLRRQHQHP